MSQALRDEVTRTGVRIDTPKAVRLPKETRAHKLAQQHAGEPAIPAGSKFTLQLGSFPTVEEAKAIQKEMSEKGVKAKIVPATVQGKHHFRVLSGGFATRAEGEDSGKSLVIHSIVDTFVVVPNPEQK
jgi:cell division septation protein DedD